MHKLRYIILLTIYTFCVHLNAQEVGNIKEKTITGKLNLKLLNSKHLSLASTQNLDFDFYKNISLYGLHKIAVPDQTSSQYSMISQKSILNAQWQQNGVPQNFKNKFNETLYGVANGKFFSVDANQMGSQWINQDAENAHRKNGYR